MGILTGRPLKIGYVWQYEATRAAPTSATALHVQAVIEGLQRRGHQVRILTLRDGLPHWSDDLERWTPVDSAGGLFSGASRPFRSLESGVRRLQTLLRLPFVRWFDSYRFSQAVSAVMGDCDVFYERFWLLATGGLMAADRAKAPLVYEVNGDLEEEYRLLGIDLTPGQRRVNELVTRRMFQRAGRVVTVSQTLRERTLQRWGLDPDQVTAVENGADVSLFSASPQAGTAGQAGSLRQQYGLGGGPLVMFVGSFKPWHGLDLLVEAFSRVSPAHPQARLAFVGDGPTRPDLEAQVSALGLAGRVIFTGAVPHPDVAALLASADVTVLNPRLSPASLSQSPLKLFEYMAAGKAIIAPDIPNMQRLLSHRQTALLVQPDQAGALAQALAELLEDEGLRRSLGQAAARQALQAHSWERTVEELEKIFLEELGRKGGR